MQRELTDDERALVQHVTRWGSDGYPVKRVGSRHWSWGPWRGVNGCPTVFPTKRAAVASFERFLEVLLEALADEACRRAWHKRGLTGADVAYAVGLASNVRAGRMPEAEFWALLRSRGLAA